MKNQKEAVCTALLSVLVLSSVRADVLELKNKSILEGKYAGGTSETIRFQVGAETKVIPLSEIVALTFTGAASGAAATPQAAPSSGAPGGAAGAAAGTAAGTAASQPAPAATATALTIPAGTELTVQMDREVDSARDSVGTRFTGKVQQNVVVNGQVAIPAGSMVAGQVNESEEARRLTGQSVLGLTLTAVTINGQQVPLATDDFTLAGAKEGKKTVRRSGGGAAIGAIAGGGEGAAKGAAIGGATALRKGEASTVPAGSVVPFRLSQPVTVGSPTGR